MGCIYKYTNGTTQESYIGFTTRDADLRRKEHISGDGNQPLKNDIDKYGEDAFTFDILEDGIIPAFLHEREKYWIAKFDTFHNGYNLTTGGGSSTEVSEETRRKISMSKKGKTLSQEHRRSLSEARKGKTLSQEHRRSMSEAHKGKTGYWKGKPRSAETKRKISKKNKGAPSHWKGKTLSQEHRRSLSEAHKGEKNHNYGKPRSAETKRKISMSNSGEKHHFFGKSHSRETRWKMSRSQKGKTLSQEHRRNVSKARETPECLAAREFFFSLPSNMPLTEKRKCLRQKFPENHRTTTYRWCKKFDAELKTPP